MRSRTGLLVGSSFVWGWDKFLVNAVCCHATKAISLYHDPILSARCISRSKNITRIPKTPGGLLQVGLCEGRGLIKQRILQSMTFAIFVRQKITSAVCQFLISPQTVYKTYKLAIRCRCEILISDVPFPEPGVCHRKAHWGNGGGRQASFVCTSLQQHRLQFM